MSTMIETAIANLTKSHRKNWLGWYAKLEKVIPALNTRAGDDFRNEDNITAAVSAEDFIAAGYSTDEADAMIFVLTEDCMGEAVDSIEMIDRWFTYCAPESR